MAINNIQGGNVTNIKMDCGGCGGKKQEEFLKQQKQSGSSKPVSTGCGSAGCGSSTPKNVKTVAPKQNDVFTPVQQQKQTTKPNISKDCKPPPCPPAPQSPIQQVARPVVQQSPVQQQKPRLQSSCEPPPCPPPPCASQQSTQAAPQVQPAVQSQPVAQSSGASQASSGGAQPDVMALLQQVMQMLQQNGQCPPELLQQVQQLVGGAGGATQSV